MEKLYGELISCVTILVSMCFIERHLPVFHLYFHSFNFLESNVTYPGALLHPQQRGSRAVPLEQKVMNNFCGVNSEPALYN